MVKHCIYTARHCVYMFLKKWHRKADTSDPPTLLAMYMVHTMYIPNCHSMRNSIVYTEYIAVQTCMKLYYSGITFITPWDFKIHSMNPDEPCTYKSCIYHVQPLSCIYNVQPCMNPVHTVLNSIKYVQTCTWHVQTCIYININLFSCMFMYIHGQ